jgi:hypothetical protein
LVRLWRIRVLSQTRYGILERDVDTLLSDQSQAEGLANFLVGRDDEPEYRFAQIAIDIDKLTTAQEADVFGLEIGDVIQVQLTPGNPPTGSAIERYGRVISIAHSCGTGFAFCDDWCGFGADFVVRFG